MKLLTASQIREADQYTIQNEPILSIDLMERAAGKCTEWILKNIDQNKKIIIFTGPGNNGGDGLAIARQLAEKNYHVEIWQVRISDKLSHDSQINLERLVKQNKVKINTIKEVSDIPEINTGKVVIDAIFGSGLSRPVDGLAKKVINKINKSAAIKVAIDIPSGLYSENNANNDTDAIVIANHTLTFQVPKQSFFLKKNERFVGKWKVLDIGLNKAFIDSCTSDINLITENNIEEFFKPRKLFSHKGSFGHALLIAGSLGKTGAAILGAKACLRSGCGLITVHLPNCGVNNIQTALPEAMVSIDEDESVFSAVPETDNYSAIGIGPGLGVSKNTVQAFKELLDSAKLPLVIDADGLNILSQNKEWLKALPKNTILTPHPGEFNRIEGKAVNDHDDLKVLTEFAQKHNCILVYKEAFTKIAQPNGEIWINPTGNPGMATAGCGDTLTGIILSFLAQGYTTEQAAKIGVYVHGAAGDLATEKTGQYALIASDIIENLGFIYKKFETNGNN